LPWGNQREGGKISTTPKLERREITTSDGLAPNQAEGREVWVDLQEINKKTREVVGVL